MLIVTSGRESEKVL